MNRIICSHCKGEGSFEPPTVTGDEYKIGRKLQAMRIAAKVTQQQLADEMGYTLGYVSNLENGRNPFYPVQVSKYEAALARILKSK